MKNRYDWPKLKAEFIAGDWLSVKQFLTDKNIPVSNAIQCTGWSEERRRVQREALQKSSQKMVDDEFKDIQEVRMRQARTARFLQLKGLAKFQEKGVTVDSIEDARKLVATGLQEERKALGMEGGGTRPNLTQINVSLPKTNMDRLLEKLDYAGILELVAELKRERARRTLPEGIATSPGEVEEGRTL